MSRKQSNSVLALILLSPMRVFADSARKVAVTIDDLPVVGEVDLQQAREVTDDLLEALKEHRVPAIGFVSEHRLYVRGEVDERIALLDRWLEAGMTLGNHTFSHVSLYKTPLAEYKDEVIRGEVVTRRLMEERNLRLAYFRPPFTNTGPTAEVKTAFEDFLETRDYKIAPFTVENADYAFDAIYVKALSDNDTDLAERVRAAYLEHTKTIFDFVEKLSVRLFDEEIRQILLIHANKLNAECLDDLLKSLAGRGYGFVSLDEALDDAAYQTPDEFVGSMGPSWLHRWSLAKGIPMKEINGREFPATLLEEPDPPKFILELYQAMNR
jgi:peptidoglycan/xylan/chitin deacetylase (PgdA/CDA1 family)